MDKLDNLKDKTIHYTSDDIHEEYPSVENEVDVLIRLAFVEFLFCPDMMGLLENHLTIYRLFPRPVVSLKRTSFINEYMVRKGDKNTDEFINTFIRSQVRHRCIYASVDGWMDGQIDGWMDGWFDC